MSVVVLMRLLSAVVPWLLAGSTGKTLVMVRELPSEATVDTFP